jgi:asparagine synthase (glutamine-hydrolysing)
MPGLAGVITRLPREQAQAEVRRMADSMLHESFYRCGAWCDETLGIYTGWVTREEGGGPVQSGDRTLMLCGEEYSKPDLARCLGPEGEDERGFLAGLNGRFHGLLADRARAAITLFNDRYGLHRLYWHQGKDAFYFAAEAKAILAVRPEARELDPRSLGEYLSCGCVLEDRSLFRNIGVLPAGSAWTFRNGALERQGRYFLPSEWEQQGPLAPQAFYQELRQAFAQCLPRYLQGARVAMSLTGGLDTRMIMAWARPAPGSLPCYTFSGPYRDSQDVRIARQVAAACGQPHESIRVDDGFLARFAQYAERTVYLSDGCAGVQHAPDLHVNERARQVAPVRLTGNYGGEVLRGVRAFKAGAPPPGLFAGGLAPHVEQAQATYRGLLGEHPVTFAAFRQAPWHHYGLLALEQSQVTLRSPFLDNDLVRAAYRAPEAMRADESPGWRMVREGNPALARIPTDRGGGSGLPALLRNAFHRFTFKAEYAYNHGMPQWLAKVDHLLRPLHLERLFLGRHKFTHFRVWYRDQLAGYVREVLLDPRALARPWIERRGLEEAVHSHVQGRSNHTTAIHTALTLELLHRSLLDAGDR